MSLVPALLRLALGRRLPITAGTIRLTGPRAPITVCRDRHGIPHIEAQNDEDAWFGLGFCQAQDRAFQLELRLRTLRGTLSELFGSRTLPIDRLARRIGFRHASEQQLAVLDDEVRGQIEAFAGGINAGLRHGLRARPHEFVLLGRAPTPWQATDVLGFGKLMSFLLIGNWDVELARLRVLREDGPEALRSLDPAYPADHPVTAPPGQPAGPALDRLSEDLAAFVSFAGRSSGSNNWAVAGSRTASGRPLLANDPHLEPTLPAHWYLAHLTTPEWSVAGAALVGGPAIGAGHNGFAAWGLTAALTDTVDLYVEEVGPDGRSVREGETFVPCAIRRELIKVRRGPELTEEVLVTKRGPIIGPALLDDPGAISMQAVWLQPRPVRGFLTVHKARGFAEFRDQFRWWPVLPQNVVYADVTGKTAWQLVGETPVRRKGWGMLPARGNDPEAGWKDEPVPFEAMPRLEDPPSGFVATANNKPVRDGEGPYLGSDWLDGYRAGRIVEALRERTNWDVRSSQQLQLDEKTLAWREVREAVLSAPCALDEARLAQGLLRDWDGRLTADSPAATVYELFIADIWRRIAETQAPRSAHVAMGQGATPLLTLNTFALGRTSRVHRLLRDQPAGWLTRGWRSHIEEALAAAVKRLRDEYGPDTAAWAWGRLRPLTLVHPVAGIAVLRSVFNRGPFPFGGDGNTLSQAGLSPLRPFGNPLAIASLRMVVDVGAWEEARFALPGGQSGNPFSPHYDDLLPAWLRGEGVPIAWSPEAVREATRSVLRLAPL